MPDYEFSYDQDFNNPDSIMVRVTARLREDEMEHFRKQLEEAYKRGWQDCQFELRLPGRPCEAERNPYSKENFLKIVAAKTCTHGVPIEQHCEECGEVFKHNSDGGVLQKTLDERIPEGRYICKNCNTSWIMHDQVGCDKYEMYP